MEDVDRKVCGTSDGDGLLYAGDQGIGLVPKVRDVAASVTRSTTGDGRQLGGRCISVRYVHEPGGDADGPLPHCLFHMPHDLGQFGLGGRSVVIPDDGRSESAEPHGGQHVHGDAAPLEASEVRSECGPVEADPEGGGSRRVRGSRRGKDGSC